MSTLKEVAAHGAAVVPVTVSIQGLDVDEDTAWQILDGLMQCMRLTVPSTAKLALFGIQAMPSGGPAAAAHANDPDNNADNSKGSGAPALVDLPVCPHCRSVDVEVVDYSLTCKACNCVCDRYIDHGAEWRTFSGTENAKQKDPSRCGMPVNELLPQGSMSTFVAAPHGGKNYRDLSRISKYQMWGAMPYKERSLFHAIDHLTVKAVNSGISQSIIDDAKVLYKQLSESHMSRGENRSGLLASSIYVACKNNGVPRSAKEVAKMFGIDSVVITRNCKKFQEIMHLRLQSSQPSDFVLRFCSLLNLPVDLQETCASLVRTIQDRDLMRGCSPPSVVAGCISYMVSRHKLAVTKKEIAAVCGVSDVTISKCVKRLDALIDAPAPPPASQ
ncbi:hypothetical protein HXX76_014048 [Chlamydomonas incerta]|uniref:Cyclin-like domain-containing protein n=1 Tax=Chlamydomonas incerta TaxID=51695 RepID=A0A835SQD4_CHLIN|nr:hypothetical protein HXX76_014048 [Chlamydomonas incerta]|eukprot:KAG2424890.1 hypothetical protein HXX76_014048 [Chlamydomonas incerta]